MRRCHGKAFDMFRGRLGERGVERGLADFDASRSFANRETLGDKRLRAPELFVSHDGFASALATAGHRCIEAGTGSFADEVALELSECAENVKDEPSAWRRGVDRFCQRAEADAACFQAVHRLDQVRQRAAEPIELPHSQDIAVSHEAQRSFQSRAIGFGSGRLVLEHASATGFGECVYPSRPPQCLPLGVE